MSASRTPSIAIGTASHAEMDNAIRALTGAAGELYEHFGIIAARAARAAYNVRGG